MSDPAQTLLLALSLAAVAAALFWPDQGLVVRWVRLLRRTERVLIEDALKHLHDDEYHGRLPTVNSLAGALGVPRNRAAELVERLESMGRVVSGETGLGLTDEGRSDALRVIRIHRLWERYLADHSGLDRTEWHPHAERLEHVTSAEQAEALATRMGHPLFDPHGDPIPTAGGEIVPARGRPLHALQPGDRGIIVHVEDEPAAVYAQLVAEGIEPGLYLRVLESTSDRVRIELEGDERFLAPVVAGNVSVLPEPVPAAADESRSERLSSLAPGERATIVDISRACFGPQRRRLLDLGLLPGTRVEAEFAAPSGEPVAYRIRGAAIALRREQADMVQVERTGDEA
jgi:DtxR family Mn-dependent transcriptional regulator